MLCFINIFFSLVQVLYVIVKIIEASMCYVDVIDVFFVIPHRSMRWSIQHCSSFHQFDLVYFL